jgi:hypothetical protein
MDLQIYKVQIKQLKHEPMVKSFPNAGDIAKTIFAVV